MVLHRRSQVTCVIIVRCGCGEGVRGVSRYAGWWMKTVELALSEMSVALLRVSPTVWNGIVFWKAEKGQRFSDLSAVPMILATSVILLKCYSVCWGSLLGIVWTSHSGKVFFFATLALRLFHGSWRRSYSRCLFVESLLDLCFIFSLPPGF